MRFLGFDTSNYTTSVAAAKDGRILAEARRPLAVKEGERGLRQQEALFQHWQALPALFHEVWAQSAAAGAPCGIAASTRPRPQDGSYMPVFTAGEQAARMLADALGVPFFALSHQEGHILAAAHGHDIDFSKPLLAAHLSGGTLEFVLLKDGRLEKVGGTKDISFGQLIDRVGVAMGMRFPAGGAMDLAASERPAEGRNPLCSATLDGPSVNLSGLETQALKMAEKPDAARVLPGFLMARISEAFAAMAENALRQTGAKTLLVSGGVACSRVLRTFCEGRGYLFGDPKLCSDNAAGIALSEGRLPWL